MLPPDPDEPDPDAAVPGDGGADRPSKTRLKQASHALQELGQAAVALPPAQLEALSIAEPLRDAIVQYKKTRTHEGRRRQMQYIGKLMRRHDVEAIRLAVTQGRLGPARDSLALHQAERWRAELLTDEQALSRWALAHPDSDLQQLRSLVRAARKDAALTPQQRSGRAYRELFGFIRLHDAA
jgi:ribosome-associated protein